ncbi:spsG Spore coat polysaccharide biosynthesis protein, predicted glycosyltransferase [Oxalobacteraceae bacterium]
MRCLTLADQLAAEGADIRFVCRDSRGAMFDVITARGFLCDQLDESVDCPEADAVATESIIRERYPAGIDWLIVDHYELDETWERQLRPYVARIMVIDDLANRRHDCDLLLDQNYYKNLTSRYDGLVADSTVLLLGPEFALLRPEFFHARCALRERDGIVRRILVFFGGSDLHNQTQCALEAIEQLRRPDIHVDVVVGSSNPHQGVIRDYCALRPWAFYHRQVSNMANLIAAADLSIGAGGATTWERCILGLPCLTVVLADNQLVASEDVASTGATICLGWAIDKSVARYANAIRSLINDRNKLLEMSMASRMLVNVRDGAVVSEMHRMMSLDAGNVISGNNY